VLQFYEFREDPERIGLAAERVGREVSAASDENLAIAARQ
jgi:hypothetical protein